MTDAELDSWRARWHTALAVAPDLKRRVEREMRLMRRFVVAECLVTLAFGGGSLGWAVLSQRTDVLVLAVGIWVFIAVAWTISVLLRHDAWSPAAMSTAAFLDLSILRCRRRREAIVAQAILYALILTFDLAWIYFTRPERASSGLLSFLTSGSVAWVWVVTAILAAVAVRQRQRVTRELEGLMHLRRSVSGGAEHAA